ncbi:MAG: hypothetical protein WCH01_08655, partial [Methylococcaceae bacterium]
MARIRAFAEMLGFDPLYKACEGRVLAVIDSAYANTAIQNLHKAGYLDAAIIVSYSKDYKKEAGILKIDL